MQMHQAESIVYTVAMLALIVALYSQALIRSKVNEQLQPDAKFSWWRSNLSTNKQLYRKYRELYPKSHLTMISYSTWWIGAVGLLYARFFWK
jgi:hypothetical protein